MDKDVQWLLSEKYGGEKSPPVFNESLDEIKNKYSWGAAFSADCERLKAGEPLAYVIGHIPFLGCTIHLDSKPLIPRPETEFWVDRCVRELKRRKVSLGHPPQREYSERGLDEQETLSASLNQNPQQSHHSAPCQATTLCDPGIASLNILDLCAGSGCIGVAIAKAIPEAHITFGEIDPAHAATIQKNCIKNGITDNRFEIITSDVYENINGRFDFVLSNPPYIDPALDRAEQSVRDFEPHRALYGGNNGMEIIAKIISQAEQFLKSSGQLWIEHEPEQTSAISLLAHEFGFMPTSYQDHYQTIRYSVLV